MMTRSLLLAISVLVVVVGLCGTVQTDPSPNDDGDDSQNNNNDKSTQPQAELVIQGEFTLVSEPLLPTSNTNVTLLHQIFASDKVRDLLISGGGGQGLRHATMTDPYWKLWQDVCNQIINRVPQYATTVHRPKPNDALLMTDVEVKFPGLRVVTTSLTGVKKVVNDDNGIDFAYYQYYLLAQKQVPYGLPHAVWIFNRIRKKNSNDDDDDDDLLEPAAGLSVSTAKLIEFSDEHSLAIQFDCWVHFSYSFPKSLMRWFPPFAKHRLQSIIRGPIINMAKREVTKGVDAAHEAITQEYLALSSISGNENRIDDKQQQLNSPSCRAAAAAAGCEL